MSDDTNTSAEDEYISLPKMAEELAAGGHVLARSPNEFLRLATNFLNPLLMIYAMEQARSAIPREEFGRPQYKPLREAWNAAIFAIAYRTFFSEAVLVRMCVPDPPDFQLRVGQKAFDFEATAVVEPGDKPGRRYAGDRTPGAPLVRPVSSMPTFNPEWLAGAVAAKAAMPNASRTHLIVYLDPGGRMTLQSLRDAAASAGSRAFSSVWVMGLEYVACLHNTGDISAPQGWFRTGMMPVFEPPRDFGARPR